MSLPEHSGPPQPDVISSMRDDLADWRQWLARLIVLAYAAAAGLSVVAFSKLCDVAQLAFARILALHPLTPLLWTTACTAGVVWLTRRFAPGAAGSGIPQVMATLDPAVAPTLRPKFVSLRLSVAKAM